MCRNKELMYKKAFVGGTVSFYLGVMLNPKTMERKSGVREKGLEPEV